MAKYIKNSSFSERIEALETARERMKLLMKSVNNSKSNLGLSRGNVKSKALSARASELKKPMFCDGMAQNNNDELEQMIKLKDEEIEQKATEINKLQDVVLNLKLENERNKSEISELNNLVSKYAAQKYIADPSQYAEAIRPNPAQFGLNNLQNNGNEDDDEEIEHTLEYSPGGDIDDDNRVYRKTDEDSFKLEVTQSANNPFEGGDQHNDDHFEKSPFIKESRRNDLSVNRAKPHLQSDESKNHLGHNKTPKRKKWDLTNNSKNTNRNQANIVANANNDSGDDEGDSSFIINFNDLESPGKYKSDESEINHLDDNIIHSRTSQVKLDFVGGVNYDTNREVMLQYIHAVSCTLEDYLME